MSTFNEISSVQSCIWNTVAPACLGRRNTITNTEPFKHFLFCFVFAPSVNDNDNDNSLLRAVLH